ncbi:hypothetical protein PMI14_03139 [Acidovorax sp. CF316]|uniref:hypothetical protein n=1 Tax=Acidovorax sp. CF316 TaxID=1144317 RepID=UPI00026BD786|nr:hypothetical protein [Acidovorax sp. CF316]EJE52161.1 hypothetical protein PMI14_03139 [Acidovorax sp. CF316]
MLLTLHIIKIESGDYRAHVMEGTEHLGDYEASSIREAILLAAENPLPDLAGFHLWYEHVCAGSVSAGEMRADAEALAQQFVERHAKFSQ